jgi:hypothetical protein
VRGHGLGWAGLYRAVALRPPLLVLCGRLAFFVLLLLFAINTPDGFGSFRSWLWVMPMLLLTFPTPAPAARRQRLYLLGADYRPQMLHLLRTFWVPVLAELLLFLGLLAWFGPNRDLSLALAAACLGAALCRAGWWEWPDVWPIPTGVVYLLLLALAAALPFWPDPWLPGLGLESGSRWLLFGLAAGTLGLAGIVAKLVALDEERLRSSMLQNPARSRR